MVSKGVIARRLVEMAAVLAVLSVALFYLLHLMPGSTEDLLLAQDPTLAPEQIEAYRRQHALDRPIHERYLCWVAGRPDAEAGTGAPCAWWPGRGVVFGDLGYSRVHKVPVASILGERLANTLALMVPAFVLALLLSIVLGVEAAIRPKSLLARCQGSLALIGISVPMHWLGMLAILCFGVELRWFPVGGIDDPRDPGLLARVHHAVLPVSVLALFYLARWSRHVRAAMEEVLELDYVRTARAKGLPERVVIWKHALPNALLPLVTVVGQSIPALFSGALITERVFAYPGMGVLIFESVEANDYLAAMTVFLLYAAITLGAAFLQDLLYARIDPRLRISSGALERGGA